jgi:hypothetical protein
MAASAVASDSQKLTRPVSRVVRCVQHRALEAAGLPAIELHELPVELIDFGFAAGEWTHERYADVRQDDLLGMNERAVEGGASVTCGRGE